MSSSLGGRGGRLILHLRQLLLLATPPPPATPPAMSPRPPPPGKARLLYCKAHVAIHPTAFKGDNVPGYLALVELDAAANDDAQRPGVAGEGVLVTWVPDQVLARMDEQDREGYRRVGELAEGDREEDGECVGALPGADWDAGFVFVSVPPPKGEKYAFSVPVTGIYSILVYPVRRLLCTGETAHRRRSPVCPTGTAQPLSSRFYPIRAHADRDTPVLPAASPSPRSTSTTTSLRCSPRPTPASKTPHPPPAPGGDSRLSYPCSPTVPSLSAPNSYTRARAQNCGSSTRPEPIEKSMKQASTTTSPNPTSSPPSKTRNLLHPPTTRLNLITQPPTHSLTGWTRRTPNRHSSRPYPT